MGKHEAVAIDFTTLNAASQETIGGDLAEFSDARRVTGLLVGRELIDRTLAVLTADDSLVDPGEAAAAQARWREWLDVATIMNTAENSNGDWGWDTALAMTIRSVHVRPFVGSADRLLVGLNYCMPDAEANEIDRLQTDRHSLQFKANYAILSGKDRGPHMQRLNDNNDALNAIASQTAPGYVHVDVTNMATGQPMADFVVGPEPVRPVDKLDATQIVIRLDQAGELNALTQVQDSNALLKLLEPDLEAAKAEIADDEIMAARVLTALRQSVTYKLGDRFITLRAPERAERYRVAS